MEFTPGHTTGTGGQCTGDIHKGVWLGIGWRIEVASAETKYPISAWWWVGGLQKKADISVVSAISCLSPY